MLQPTVVQDPPDILISEPITFTLDHGARLTPVSESDSTESENSEEESELESASGSVSESMSDAEGEEEEGEEEEEDAGDARLRQAFNAGQPRVPRIVCPFLDQEAVLAFQEAVQTAQTDGFVPSGFGLIEDEEDFEAWNPAFVIKVARKEEEILLPESIWRRRAVHWVRGLHILNYIFMNNDESQESD